MKNINVRNIVIIILITIFSFSSFAKSNKTIKIVGNKRIENNTIKSYFKGYNIDNIADLNKVLQKLYNSSLFADIGFKITKKTLTVNLKENPTIHTVELIGNKALSNDVITQEIELSERSIYTKAQLIKDIQRITEIYKRSGRINIKITPKLKILKDNRIDLILRINEGKKARIKKIYFHNNKKLRSEELRDILISKETKWYRGSSSFFDPDKTAYDKRLITRYYFNQGYANFKLINSTVEYLKELNSFIINFYIKEGSVYKFKETEITSAYDDINVLELQKFITFKEGKRFSLDKIESSVDKILSHLNDKGFAFANVNYDISNNNEAKFSKVIFSIKKNKKIYIRQIKIIGNNITEDQVLRREIRILEGDIFNNTKLKRSRRRLENLRFFSSVQIKKFPVQGTDLMDIVFEVKEQSTGELNFGFGYSTTERFLGNASIKERNLKGKGHSISLNTQKTSRSQNVDISYVIPNFFNREFSYGFDIFDSRRNLEESDTEIISQGISNRIFYDITENLSQSLSYTYKIDQVKNVSSSSSNFLAGQEGDFIYSALVQNLSFDKRDRTFDTKSGYVLRFGTSFAGVGGDTTFLKIEPTYAHYFPIWKKKIVFRTLLKGGVIEDFNKEIRINYRFFLGGASLKGFRNAGIGPRDEFGASLGGKYYYKASGELLFPLGLPEELGFKGSLFYEAGTVTNAGVDNNTGISDNGSLRQSVGFGINWRSPLGPIRFDFAKAIKKEEYDNIETFRINFGTRF